MPLHAERRLELLKLAPDGLPVTRQWLMQQNKGFDRHAIDNLLKSDQLIPLAYGVYIRPGTHLTWEGIVCFLQHILKTDITVGGLTALELKGLHHYLTLSGKKRFIFTAKIHFQNGSMRFYPMLSLSGTRRSPNSKRWTSALPASLMMNMIRERKLYPAAIHWPDF